jgi:hypothetical protein
MQQMLLPLQFAMPIIATIYRYIWGQANDC